MKKLLSGLCATTLALSFAAASVMPSQAAPIFVPKTAEASSDVLSVRDHGPRYNSRNYQRRGNNYYFNGHRGYRYQRPGYRSYNGMWFPLAAFAAGAINQPRVVERRYVGNSHVQWCYDRYRSYRASDNTFQPYNGPRQQCYSPY